MVLIIITMELTCIHNIDTTQKFIKCRNIVCYFCHANVNLQEAYFEDKIVNVCCLCYIIVNHKKEDVDSCLLGFTSKLTQTLIIKKTREYYETNKCIPLPTELDSDSCLVNISVYLFSQFKNKDKLDDFCVFFTSKIQNKMSDEFEISGKKIPIYKYFELSEHKFTDKENEIVKIEIDNIKKKNFSVMKNSEDEFNKKISSIHT